MKVARHFWTLERFFCRSTTKCSGTPSFSHLFLVGGALTRTDFSGSHYSIVLGNNTLFGIKAFMQMQLASLMRLHSVLKSGLRPIYSAIFRASCKCFLCGLGTPETCKKSTFLPSIARILVIALF